MTHTPQACAKCQTNFIITEDDKAYYSKLKIAEPTFCPDCRQNRRLTWRNERNLYKRKCDATGNDTVSVFSQDKDLKVYQNDYWYSDKWDAMEYGVDFDFTRPFFEQFEELMKKVPQLALSSTGNFNSDYVNQCGWCKNCYLIFEANFNENCLYSYGIYDSKSTIDCFGVSRCELCYECVNCKDCYNLKFSQDSQNCSDSWYLKNCIGCKDCFGCVNLKNKQYYFLNKQLTKEEYFKKIAELKLNQRGSLKKLREDFTEFAKKFPQKYLHGTQNEDSTGDYLNQTQRCTDCYDLATSQDCKYVSIANNAKACYDITVFGANSMEFCCENHEVGQNVRNIFYSDQVWEGCYEVYYSKLCMQNSHDLFGCIGLKHKSFCILNKQYTPEEYQILKQKIIEHMKKTGEWGEFFPASMSPFAYNETLAQEYYPLTREQVAEQGLKWKDPEEKTVEAQNSQLPDDIKQVTDDILKQKLQCEECKYNFKIVEEELKFYRQFDLPVPQKCHDCRHKSRFKLRNPRHLYNRNCAKCQAPISTTYSPDRPEVIYCEKCFQDELQ